MNLTAIVLLLGMEAGFSFGAGPAFANKATGRGDEQFLESEQSSKVSDETFAFVGNNYTHVIHQPSCDFAHRIWHTHVVLFHEINEALSSDYKACNWCLPKWSTEVSGRILTKKKVPKETPKPE